MDPQNRNGWPQHPGIGSSLPDPDRSGLQQRPVGSYTPNHNATQVPPMQMPASAPTQPQSQGHFYGPAQSNSHPLPPLSGIPQTSPRQGQHPATQHQRSSPPLHSQGGPPAPPASQQGPGYALPAIGQAIHGPAERERQYHEAEMREIEERQHLQEREFREQQQQHQQHQQRLAEQQRSPPSAHAGSLTLQQPIASRAPAILHGPNGLLNANSGIAGAANPPGAHPSIFTNGVPANEGSVRPYQSSVATNNPQHPAAVLGGLHHANDPNAAVPSQGGIAGPAVAQGQQPILNDALSYLDLVKVRFQEQPDVYNRFLDIMKDFKSQAIDTPGVIERVSSLFSGHPQLIEGFNTFLPPGYRIEAGWDNDPNQIRVTTPMGTTTCRPSMLPGQLGSRSFAGPAEGPGAHAQQVGDEQARASDAGWIMSGARQGQLDGAFSPNARPGAVAYGQQTPTRQGPMPQYGLRENELHANDAAALAHQQEQRGVSQLQNAVNVAVDSQAGRMSSIHPVPIEGGAGIIGRQSAGLNGGPMNMPAASQPGVEKRGPIEFNHAINYVNKIKVRFASQPEVYKRFLEILQTYQRESKPIQDVYAQVTELFDSARDLLEDFKQFLPESAAHAKSQAMARHNDEAALTSNLRGEASYVSNMPRMSQTPKPDKMPPLGNFPPPSTSKENKKRRAGGPTPMTLSGGPGTAQDAAAARANGQGAHAAKKQKMTVGKAVVPELAVPSPSLVPELPTPMPPSATSGSQEALAWFERVKKYIGNRQTYNEFLKLCNLFTQELIDATTLVHKASTFIGQNSDLMTWFKTFVSYSGEDQVIENRPVQSSNKVVLSNCRGLGPSYRLLPVRERFAKCSGRDEMCREVLNDEWATHPTWASEDSGFVSHRKNQHEEALYRMEEERHDYDFNIETCQRTIQLLEPIVAQINALDPKDHANFKLPFGLGGASEAIWQRVIKKLYDRPIGCKIIADMYAHPAKACPVILSRLKNQIEKWKQAQREWEKVWREQTYKQFWKSLDHQGLTVKGENKRNFQPKALQTEIQAKYEERRREKQIKPFARFPSYHLDMTVSDAEVVQDTCHMLLTYLRTTHQGGDHAKIESFLKNFIPAFFGLDREAFGARMADIYSGTPPNEEEEEAATNDEAPVRGRRNGSGKKNLLRGVLDPSKQTKKDAKEESKESTPDVMSLDEDSSTQTDGQSDQATKLDASDSRWMEHPVSGNSRNRQHIKHNEPYERQTFGLYASLHIYCFMRMFTMLYERLHNVKALETHVQEDVRRALLFKPASHLLIADRGPKEFFEDTSPSANYYRQIVKLCESYLERNVDMIRVEETFRRWYLPSGWQLYSFDKMLGAIIKFIGQVVVNDAKDRSNDIINLFLNNRKESQTTHQTEIDYRKQVEKLAKDSDVYRINWNTITQHVTFQVLKKDDQTLDMADMPPDVNWSYYVTAFAMRDWTEGVSHDIYWPFKQRNLPKNLETEEDLNRAYLPMSYDDGLTIRVATKNYRLLWERGTTDWWVHDPRTRARGLKHLPEVSEARRTKFEERFVEKPKWMEGMSEEEIEKIKSDFQETWHSE